MGTKIDKLLCKIGIHRNKQAVSAPYRLFGVMGRIEAWVCKNCDYKCPRGKFISEEIGDKIEKEVKL